MVELNKEHIKYKKFTRRMLIMEIIDLKKQIRDSHNKRTRGKNNAK